MLGFLEIHFVIENEDIFALSRYPTCSDSKSMNLACYIICSMQEGEIVEWSEKAKAK